MQEKIAKCLLQLFSAIRILHVWQGPNSGTKHLIELTVLEDLAIDLGGKETRIT
jgi:hypothetical protein